MVAAYEKWKLKRIGSLKIKILENVGLVIFDVLQFTSGPMFFGFRKNCFKG